ncbi:MAG TPA: Gfo/Idh/MocA family oxidoreductase [Verrucomicrobiae bacterium]|jgi:predicted dehydrogenase|nr:Gfo/Idh/MocA family oxidoreductase [Verrucomicrobiae bacterium]
MSAKASSSRGKLRAAIAGCGRIAGGFDKDPKRKYVATHAGAYTRSKDFELVAVCDNDAEKLKEFGKTWSVGNLYGDFGEMLRKEKPDLVSICTWPESHFDLCVQAIRAGVKGIFCEKPVTDRLDKADELLDLCRKTGTVLAVNHSRRWDTGLQKLKRVITGGKLGKIHQVQCFYTAGISNTGTHLFDLLRDFLGDVDSVMASPAPVFGDKDLTLSGELIFKNGTRVSLCGLNVQDYLIFEMDFYGSKGRLRIKHSGFGMEAWKVGPSKFFSGYKELTPVKLAVPLEKKNMMMNAVKDLAACVRSGKQPLSTAEDGLKALELICAFHESFKRGGERLKLPLAGRKAGL